MSSCTLFLHDPNALRAAAFAAILAPWAHRSQVGLRVSHDPEELADLADLETTSCLYPIGGWSLRHPSVMQTINCLRDISPSSPLIVFADVSDAAEIAAAIDCGLQGFIPTTMPANVALAAIQFIINGGTYHPHPLAISQSPAQVATVTARILKLEDHHPIRPECSDDARPPSVLDDSSQWIRPEPDVVSPKGETWEFGLAAPTKRRHVEVLEYLAKGESNKEIARHLNLTEATIKVYVRELMKHFNAKNRMQVALRASALVEPQAAAIL